MLLTGTEALILKALQEHLSTIILFPTLTIAYIGINFDPPDSGMWLEATIFPSPSIEMGMENDPSIVHRGVFQVGVVDVTGKGALEATEIASMVVSHFKKGTKLTALGTILRITNRPSISGPIQEDNQIIIPISIQYFSSE